jgi:hypothetical protein
MGFLADREGYEHPLDPVTDLERTSIPRVEISSIELVFTERKRLGEV